MSNLVVSPRMSLQSPRCVKLLEVCHVFLFSFIHRVSAVFGVESTINSLMPDRRVSRFFHSGRSYCVRTQRMLNQCLESLVQKVQSGVVINFEKNGPDPPPIGEGE